MKVFRIERQKYVKDTLKGLGAAQCEGMRWNSLHTPMVYTAESRALAALEIAVHMDLSEDLPNDRILVEIEIPKEVKIEELTTDQLPRGWNAKPPHAASQRIGDAFVHASKAAVLKVPSAVIPQEFNYLINPAHPDAKKIKVVSKNKFVLDRRIGKDNTHEVSDKR